MTVGVGVGVGVPPTDLIRDHVGDFPSVYRRDGENGLFLREDGARDDRVQRGHLYTSRGEDGLHGRGGSRRGTAGAYHVS